MRCKVRGTIGTVFIAWTRSEAGRSSCNLRLVATSHGILAGGARTTRAKHWRMVLLPQPHASLAAATQGARETVVRLFDLVSGKELAQYPQGSEVPYFALAFSPDGKTLACGFSDQSCLLDCATGRVLHRLTNRALSPSFSR